MTAIHVSFDMVTNFIPRIVSGYDLSVIADDREIPELLEERSQEEEEEEDYEK